MLQAGRLHPAPQFRSKDGWSLKGLGCLSRAWLRFRFRQGDHNAPAARYCPLGYHRNASESGLRPATGRSADSKDAASPEGSVQVADTQAGVQVVISATQISL